MEKYDVVLSFAGEDREYAKALANLLKARDYSCFYDENELADLWGKNLYDYLSSVYKDRARYCVMFLSKHYERKLWTNHERQLAQARAFQENREYILPVRLDDTEIPGIPPTVGYLDLRSMTIEEVYQALVKKLSGATSPITTSNSTTSAAVEDDSTEYVLFNSEDGKLYFFPCQNARWDSTQISLELLPESPEEAAFLSSLRRHIRDRFARDGFIGFAMAENAALVKPVDIAQIAAGSQNIWKVVLNEKENRQNGSFLNDMTFNGISPDELAEMRARRILLNEKLEALPGNFQNRTGTVGLFNEATLEMFVRGGNGFQVSASALPTLYRSLGQTGKRFEKFARLISVLQLKLSDTVEEILTLDLKLLNPKELQVGFKGRRRQRYSNFSACTIEVNGICPLSE